MLSVVLLLAPALAQRQRNVRERANRRPGARRTGGLVDTTQEGADARIHRRALRKVTTPATRAQAITALLGHAPSTAALTKALKGPVKSVPDLATMSLSGVTIPPGTAAIKAIDIPENMNPTIDELDWDAGVHFSPWGCPRIQIDGVTRTIGIMELSGVLARGSYGMDRMHDEGVVLVEVGDSSVVVFGRVPEEAGTYVVTFKLVPADGTDLSDWLDGPGAGRTVSATIVHGVDGDTSEELTLVPLEDGSGFAAVATITAAQQDVSSYDWRMGIADWRVDIEGTGIWGFGGIVLSRL